MIKTTISHLQINVHPQNIPFYKDLLGFIGWSVLYEDLGMLGVGDGLGASLWFAGLTHNVSNDYDGPGMNHLSVSLNRLV